MRLTRRDLAAVVLAAGLGTRLRPLTDLRPKALCPVGNVPLVDLAIGRVRTVADDVAVNVHAGRAQMEEHLSARVHPVHTSVEEQAPLGTAGALGRLRDWISGRAVIVTNADAWHRFDLRVLLEGWDGRRSRLLVIEDPERGDFGSWRYIGSALMPWSAVRELSDEPSGLYEVLWQRQQEEGHLELVPVNGEFHDCGTPADYLAANLAAAGGSSVVAPTARVEGTVIRSVVWPDSVVERGECLVERIRAGALTV